MDDKAKYLLIIPVILLLVFSYFYFKNRRLSESVSPDQTTRQNTPKSFVEINGHKFFVQLATTDAEKDRGLSYQQSLPKNQGMLFVFEDNSQPLFWMKGMNFPLDMIWISKNKVLSIDANVPIVKSDTADSDIPLYQPPSGIDYVLEVNAGIVEKLAIKPGDSVTLSIQ
jgi:uncharacterized membrane protein (UPF0127 family)